jgi:hypothetical protein
MMIDFKRERKGVLNESLRKSPAEVSKVHVTFEDFTVTCILALKAS